MDFEVITGGMVTGARVGSISQIAGYISSAYKNVEETSGVLFGEAYLSGLLKDNSVVMDSVPPSKAVEVVKQLNPAIQIPLVHALQKAHYFEGKDYNAESTYQYLCELFNLDNDRFIELWNSEEIAYRTNQNFQWSAQAGISGFPTTLLEYQQQYYLLAQGFLPLDQLEERLAKALAAAESA